MTATLLLKGVLSNACTVLLQFKALEMSPCTKTYFPDSKFIENCYLKIYKFKKKGKREIKTEKISSF